jgi:thiol-disulfide isomerase/thioredoxin
MKKNYTLFIVLAAVAVFYFWRYRTAPEIDSSAITVSDSLGKTSTLNDLLSDSSIVICYASWCGPCLKELRSLKTHFEEFRDTGIRFYCITDDSPEKIEVMRANMPTEITFLHTASLNDIGIYTIPASFFYLHNQLIEKRLDAIDLQDKNAILESFNNN